VKGLRCPARAEPGRICDRGLKRLDTFAATLSEPSGCTSPARWVCERALPVPGVYGMLPIASSPGVGPLQRLGDLEGARLEPARRRLVDLATVRSTAI